MRKLLVLFLMPLMLVFSGMTFAGSLMNGKNTQVLFVLLSKEASIQSIKDKPGVYLLSLRGVNSHVIYFSNRPARISGQISMSKFIDQWKNGSFSKAAPNAMMEAVKLNTHTRALQKHETSYPIVLNKPIYHADSDEMTFEVKAIPGSNAAISVVKDSDYVAVFVDQVCLSCIG